MKITLSNEVRLTIFLEQNYLQLAKMLDYCTTKEESESIILQDDNYKLIYESLPERNNLMCISLYHFIRSRIAFFQMNFIWFQKETLALINLWLSNLDSIHKIIQSETNKDFLKYLTFGHTVQSTGFPNLWEKQPPENLIPLEPSTLLLLHQLKKDKLKFIEMNASYQYKSL